ncbi:MAG TPA: phosphonate C-P lyase system protein PhnH [Acidisoma sp.]|jgi:alpha-D-ribose 1-methylphosphonate 5-triphosphate synthase subunit PhnH|nr:phosphonate C-P lyase system protein PhnH [Acidisoma sp.]
MTLDKPGFIDPVMEAQACFRVVLRAMSRPGQVIRLDGGVAAPPLEPATASVLLTLVDAEVSLWLDDSLASSWDWLAFHAGVVRAVEPGAAAFLCATTLPPLSVAFAGTDDAPETGATIILQVPSLSHGRPITLYGPGLEAPMVIAPTGLPDDFITQWEQNHRLFPRGVDLLLCSGASFCALPRSVRIGEG